MGTGGCEKLTGAASPKAAPAGTNTAMGLPSKPQVSADEVLAKVNDTVISRRDLELTLQTLKAARDGRGLQWNPLSPEELKNVLDLLIMDELRAQDGVARGLDHRTEVQTRFWSLHRNFYAQEWVSAQLDQVKVEVTEAEVEKVFQENAMFFRVPGRIRLRELVIKSEDEAKAALVKLLENLDFATVAQTVSMRPDLASGAMVDTQWVMRGAEKATFAAEDETSRALDSVSEQAAFAIDQVGGVSSYVKGADGHFHIFQLVERQEGRQRTLTEPGVSDAIRNLLWLRRLDERSKALQAKAKVETFSDRLTSVEQP